MNSNFKEKNRNEETDNLISMADGQEEIIRLNVL